jgi:hypothetical protein
MVFPLSPSLLLLLPSSLLAMRAPSAHCASCPRTRNTQCLSHLCKMCCCAQSAVFCCIHERLRLPTPHHHLPAPRHLPRTSCTSPPLQEHCLSSTSPPREGASARTPRQTAGSCGTSCCHPHQHSCKRHGTKHLPSRSPWVLAAAVGDHDHSRCVDLSFISTTWYPD